MIIDERIGRRMYKAELGSSDRVENEIVYTTKESERRSMEWKGGAALPERRSWGRWLLEAFDMYVEEPKCKGWEHGLVEDTGQH